MPDDGKRNDGATPAPAPAVPKGDLADSFKGPDPKPVSKPKGGKK